MKRKFVLLLACALVFIQCYSQGEKGLFFSEYIANGWTNALEIFNPTGDTIELNHYSIVRNGSFRFDFPGGVLLPYSTWVGCRNEPSNPPDPWVLAVADTSWPAANSIWFLGNNALIQLLKDGKVIDAINGDPRNGTVAGIIGALEKKTLIRKPSVLVGDTIWDSSRGTNADDSQWIVSEVFYDDLGKHSVSLPSIPWLTVSTGGNNILPGTTVIDFGGVKVGETVNRDFLLENTDNENDHLLKIKCYDNWFSLSDTILSITKGGQETLGVSFSPIELLSRNSTIEITGTGTTDSLFVFGIKASVFKPRPTNYKCLFNWEGLIFCTFMKDKLPGTTGPAYIASFVDKLKDTDVDAVMFDPQAWRTNIYPSEVDPRWKEYNDTWNHTKYKGFDYIMKYIKNGGDPMKEALQACRSNGKSFFVSYRMNDHHYITDKTWPTHTNFWRAHPEYWLGDSDVSGASTESGRMHNYMLEPVRDWYYSILEELCTNYDTDGLELDFQRSPRFFYDRDVNQGKEVMTQFVQKIRTMLDQLGQQRGKSLKLCVRMPATIALCEQAGLDVLRWDSLQLVDMINVSSFYRQSLNIDIEGFKSKIKFAKVYGEILSYTQTKDDLRYTTVIQYRSAALNLLSRGADGISFFNYDYIPHDKRIMMAEGLKKITDTLFLKAQEKNYFMNPSYKPRLFSSDYQFANDESFVELTIPQNTGEFSKTLLRVETQQDCTNQNIAAWLNGTALTLCESEITEQSIPIPMTPNGYPSRDKLKFYEVPSAAILQGKNKFVIRNLDRIKSPCTFVSLELWMSPNPKVTTSPVVPVLNEASLITTTSFKASWASVSDAAKYQIDISTDDSFGSILTSYNNLSVYGESFIVTGLSSNTKYYYRVRAVGYDGNATTNSATKTVTTMLIPDMIVDGSFSATVAGNFSPLGSTSHVSSTIPYGVWGGVNTYTTDPQLASVGVTAGGVTGNCAFFTPGTSTPSPVNAYLYQRLPNPTTLITTKVFNLSFSLRADNPNVMAYAYIKSRATNKYAVRTNWISGNTYAWCLQSTNVPTFWTDYSQSFVFSKQVASAASTSVPVETAFTETELNDMIVGFYSTGGKIYIDDVKLMETVETTPPTEVITPLSENLENFVVVNGRQISVLNYSGDFISVYNMTGQLVFKTNKAVFDVDRSGLFIVRMGNKVQKIIINH